VPEDGTTCPFEAKVELLPAFRVLSCLSAWSCLVEGLPPRVSDEGTLEPSLRLNRHLGSNPRVWHGMKIFAASIRPFLAEVVMPLLQFQPAYLGENERRNHVVAFTWGVRRDGKPLLCFVVSVGKEGILNMETAI
jgi:hypothetical protein